jgi:hypothetical protein
MRDGGAGTTLMVVIGGGKYRSRRVRHCSVILIPQFKAARKFVGRYFRYCSGLSWDRENVTLGLSFMLRRNKKGSTFPAASGRSGTI